MKFAAMGVFAALITGCSAFEQSTCYEGVKAAFPDSEVAIIPGEKYRFIVKKRNGDVVYVETMSLTSGSPTQEFIAFKGAEF